ncbi:hypothetical protein QBC33DRAFT_584355 [Phialemonium atrogriseum]|uniref:Uncharacterized protein n=1 Tax=Phialemonium atrogriseum TaxID=1093897 RepID=A0AAJ0C9Z7_9PEZI|nr:uncharacterized protein QBC33DRAFT_584355 [Phialemonium atrogriseum]KAK1772883.1 hypothetical protein QBC33DRAFT_584355 [Phialemonium atrogriseum]
MASPNHGSFHERLSHLLQTHPVNADQSLARSALMWLSVARRPLRAHELWIALQIEGSRGSEHMERLLSEKAYVDEQEAASSLRHLLGGLIKMTKDASDPNKINVALCDAELRTYLGHIDDATAEGDSVRSLAFSTPQAHIFLASVCMAICSVSTLHLAHAHDDTRVSSLVLYSWSYWNAHFSLSGYTLANENAANVANSMVFGVSKDVLVLLLSLNDFITGPLTFRSDTNRLECAASIQRAQRAIEQPMVLLSAIVRQEGYAATLQGARQIFEASKYSHAGPRSALPQKRDSRVEHHHQGPLPEGKDSGVLLNGSTAGSKVGTLRIDNILAETEFLFGETERQTVHAFAEVARGLRSVCVAFATHALYAHLCRQYDGGWSPMDVLVNAAEWMEALASYPYWQEIPEAISHNPLAISDTSDENYEAARLVLEHIKSAGPSSLPTSDKSLPRLSHESGSSKPPVGISAARWYAATAVSRATNWASPATPGSTFTINDVRSLSHRTSSFASFTSQMLTPDDPLRFLQPFIPNALRGFYRKRMTPLLGRITHSSIADTLDQLGSGALTGRFNDNWPLLKSALLSDGYRAAAAYVGIAILLNHVRRTLFPWMGTYMFHDPMEDLRLVLSRPDVFLDQVLSFSLGWAIFSYAQKYACDILGGLAMGLLLLDNDRAPQATLHSAATGDTATLAASPKPVPEPLMRAARVGYILWALSAADYIFARTANTISFLLALRRLLLPRSPSEHLALTTTLKSHLPALPLVALQLHTYTTTALWPLSRAALLGAASGSPGLLLLPASAAAACWAVLRFRARLYMAIQLAGMFVALALAVAGSALLAAEFAADPLGLAGSAAAAERLGRSVRGGLPRGAAERIQVLAGGRGRGTGPAEAPLPGRVGEACGQ